MKKRILFSFMALMFCHNLSASDLSTTTLTPITIGNSITLHSDVLDEDRTIQIALPASYEEFSTQTYPVLYLLDGESNFHYLTGMINKLSRAPYPAIPEMIVVGIVNTDRTRDLTPSVVLPEAGEDVTKGRSGTKNGGNPEFFQFLEEEVMPKIEKNYRTADYNVFVGHSFGGITALNHLINGQKKMNAYIVHDPSIWWDSGEMLKRYEALKGSEVEPTKLFVTQAGEAVKDGQLDHYNNVQGFNAYMETAPIKGLEYAFVGYEGEDHGSVPMKGNLDGLRYVFEGMRLNIKAIPDNPDLIKEQYAALSHSLGVKIEPSEPYLAAVISYMKRIDRPDLVTHLETYAKSLYPNGNIAQGGN